MKHFSKSVILTSKQNFSTTSQLRRDNELKIAKKIKSALSPTFVSVQDTTLGLNSCGNMYKITVQSPVFQKKSRVEQWRLVASAISDEMKGIHGFNLKTRIPSVLQTEMNLAKTEEQKPDNTQDKQTEKQ